MKFILLFQYLFIILSCPFKNFDEALLPENKAFYSQEIPNPFFENPENNLQMVGFWTFYIPQYESKNHYIIDQDFDDTLDELGQLLFIIKDDKNYKILGFLQLNEQEKTIVHKIQYFSDIDGELVFNFDVKNYEGHWIFILISLKLNEIVIQMTNTDMQSCEILFQNKNLNFILGGEGLIQIKNQQYNLKNFKGRKSKLFINKISTYDDQTFTLYQSICSIPPQYQNGEQTIKIIDGLKVFNGDQIYQTSFQQSGSRFYIQGWVKFNFAKVTKFTSYPLLRISTRKNYSYLKREGDQILFLYAVVMPQFNYFSTIFGMRDYHNFPLFQSVENYDFYQYDEIFFGFDYDAQYGLQEWHQIKYESGITNQNYKSKLQIQYFNEIGIQTLEFDGKQLTNSIYYVFIGGDNYYTDLTYVQIYDLIAQFNYDENKDFSIQNCHSSCKSCNGPYNTNCLSCEPVSNRIYLPEKKQCECKNGYLDKGVIMCEDSINYFGLIVQEIVNDITNKAECQFGNFNFPINQDSFICVQCPQPYENNIYCLDCLQNPQTWYLEPVCTRDLIQQTISSNYGYHQIQREKINYDVYFIDEAGFLTLHKEFQEFCNLQQSSDCFKIEKYQHLGQNPFVLCKKNYYQSNGECIYSNPYCLNVNNKGECMESLSNMYLFQEVYYQCPVKCPECYFDKLRSELICQKCLEGFTLTQGKCFQCGENCKTCHEYYDDFADESYLKCYQCIDNSKYFISFDGVNCQENQIQRCIYAFQADEFDFTINTLDIYFQRRKNLNNILTHCASCDSTYFLYVLQKRICIRGRLVDCSLGITDDTCDVPVDSEFQNQVNKNGYYQKNGQRYYLASDMQGNDLSTLIQTCLITDTYTDTSIQFNTQCSSQIKNCSTCLRNNFLLYYYTYVCLICESGYYSESTSGKCKQCPIELNCYQCIQIQKINDDEWKINIRAFYKKLIEEENLHPFILHGQSVNEIDYYVKCTLCQDGYELYGSLCIKSCPDSCLECKIIEKQQICIKCKINLQGRELTIINNECIECSQNCALCIERKQNELKQVNPLFQNSFYQVSSFKCLKRFQNQKYYLDEILNKYINCESINTNCFKKITIKLNLYCSKDKFENKLNQIKNEDDLSLFLQSNIYFGDLVSGKSFQYFENDLFYTFANQQSIKLISIEIISSEDLECEIQDDGLIQQIFSENIYSAINVSLNLNFSRNTIFIVQKSLLFQNFQKISILGVKLNPQSNNFIKLIGFYSKFQQFIQLNNIQYFQTENVFDTSKFIIQNLQTLQIQNFQITNLQISQPLVFFEIIESEQGKSISIENFHIMDSSLKNQIFFSIPFSEYDHIQLTNITFLSEITNFTFISNSGLENKGSISINNLSLFSNVMNSNFLFDLTNFQNAFIKQILISKIIITNSTLFLMNNNVRIEDFIVKNSIFEGVSFALKNSLKSNYGFRFELKNINIMQNQLDQNTSQVIQFKKYDTLNSQMKIEFLSLKNNVDYKNTLDISSKMMRGALLQFEFDKLEISQIEIERGYGLIDISISDAKNVMLKNIKIVQGEQFKFKGLHQFLDCQIQEVKGTNYVQSIFIEGSNQLLFENLVIKSAQSYDNPIIQYKSADILKNNQQEQIVFQNAIIENNLLLLTKTEMALSIIRIYSEQLIKIEFNDIIFQNNILHQYIQDYFWPSALLLNFDCYKGNITILNSNFKSNSVYNSSDNIIQIKSFKLDILNCKFTQNSIFDYLVVRPYLLWGFNEFDQVSIDDLIEIFQIKSSTGNGLLTIEQLNIKNCEIDNSQGSQGGGFKIVTQKLSKVEINTVKFENISNLFRNQDEIGGCLYIDAKLSYELNIAFSFITANEISGQGNGGLVYLISGNGKINFTSNNLKIKNIYSQSGSVFYIQFDQQAIQKQIFLCKYLEVQNNIQGMIKYFSNFFRKQPSELEQLNFAQNMSLFYIENGYQLDLQQITIKSINLQSILKSKYVSYTYISDLIVLDSQWQNIFIHLTPNQNQKSNIQITHVIIKSIYNFFNNNNILCTQSTYLQSKKQFKCLNKQKPLENIIVISNQEKNKLNFGQCMFLTLMQNQIQKLNMILIEELQPNTQIRINQLQISDVDCSQCLNGLILIQFSSYSSLRNSFIQNLYIENSQCGNQGCLQITKSNQISEKVIEDQNNLDIISFECYIVKYFCKNNTSNYGTCLNVNNVKTQIDQAYFNQNVALKFGGAIFIKNENDIIITDSIITENQAQVGGGLYFDQISAIQFIKLQTIIEDNYAQFYASNILQVPVKLKIAFGSSYLLETKTIVNLDEHQVDKVIIPNFRQIDGSYSNQIKLPSGQKLSEYRFFDWKKSVYIPFQRKLRLVALNYQNEIIQNLTDTYCKINSQIFNLSSQKEVHQNKIQNYTNIQEVKFDSKTQDYNLDELIIYFNSQLSIDLQLLLEFSCSAIKIPIYNQRYPFNIQKYHQNYSLQFYVRSFDCQFGEIMNFTDFSCQLCDGEQGQFSLQLNSGKCFIKDDLSTINVSSAQLNLKQGYWRPYFDSNIVSSCLNLPDNCLGGWDTGDSSCYLGHIGALCEQCDIFNIKGDGAYSVSEKYSCGKCTGQGQNRIIIVTISIWTLIMIIMSVQSTLKLIKEFFKSININQIFLILTYLNNQSGILIKLLTNYLQIISSITTFKFQLPLEFISILQTVGSPLQNIAYSLDCFLAESVINTQIQYTRIIWLIMMPFLYIVSSFCLFLFAVSIKMMKFNISMLTTTLIYIYIYFQPNLIGGIIELLSYRQISDYKWILSNVAFRYDTNYHQYWILRFLIPVLIILAFVIPIILFLGVFFNRNQLYKKQIFSKWGYLYMEYKNQAYFWEIIKILQKEGIILVLTYFVEQLVIKASLIIIILILYQELNLKYQPFNLSQLNQLDRKCAVICLISIILALTIYFSEQQYQTSIIIISSYILFSLNIFFLIKLIYLLIREYFKEFFGDNLDLVFHYVITIVSKRFRFLQNNNFFQWFCINKREQRNKARLQWKKLKCSILPLVKQITIIKNNKHSQFVSRTILVQQTEINLLTVRNEILSQQFIDSQRSSQKQKKSI